MMSFISDITEIKHGFYINLDNRTDRKEQVEHELKQIGLSNVVKRFNAIRAKDGRVGCTISHLKCLEIAKEMDLPHILIIEDDIQFLEPSVFKKQLNIFLKSGTKWDVILLAGNNVPPYIRVHDCAIKVGHCQTTTGYIVNRHYYDTLMTNIRDGLGRLLQHPQNHNAFAIDKFWIQLQKRDKWFLITPLTVTQREGYSDIEQRHLNYSDLMTDLDKEKFLIRQRQNP